MDESGDVDLSSFEIVSLDNQPSDEELVETTDNSSWAGQNVTDVTDDVINRNVGVASTTSDVNQLDNEVGMNAVAECPENEPGAYV